MKFIFILFYLFNVSSEALEFIGKDIFFDEGKSSRFVQMCPLMNMRDPQKFSVFTEQFSLRPTPQGCFIDPEQTYILTNQAKPIRWAGKIVPSQEKTTHVILKGEFPKVKFSDEKKLAPKGDKKQFPREFENAFMVFTPTSWREVMIRLTLSSSDLETIPASKEKEESFPATVQTNTWEAKVLAKKYVNLEGKFEWIPCQFSMEKKDPIPAEFKLLQKVTLTKKMLPESEGKSSEKKDLHKPRFVHESDKKKENLQKKEDRVKEDKEEESPVKTDEVIKDTADPKKEGDIKDEKAVEDDAKDTADPKKEGDTKDEKAVEEEKKEDPKLVLKEVWDYDEKVIGIEEGMNLRVPLVSEEILDITFLCYLGKESKFPSWISELENKRFYQTKDRRGFRVLTDVNHHVMLKGIKVEKEKLIAIYTDNKSALICPLQTQSSTEIKAKERLEDLKTVIEPLVESMKPKEKKVSEEDLLKELREGNDLKRQVIKLLERIAAALEKDS